MEHEVLHKYSTRHGANGRLMLLVLPALVFALVLFFLNNASSSKKEFAAKDFQTSVLGTTADE